MLLHPVDDLCGLIDIAGLSGNQQIILPGGYPNVEGVPH
jgi:hypothetical protein